MASNKCTRVKAPAIDITRSLMPLEAHEGMLPNSVGGGIALNSSERSIPDIDSRVASPPVYDDTHSTVYTVYRTINAIIVDTA